MYQQEREGEREKDVLAVEITLDVYSLSLKKEKKLWQEVKHTNSENMTIIAKLHSYSRLE